jgi:hypothetical protein
VSSAAQDLALAPSWYAPIEELLGRAAREIRILSALTPKDARAERERLVGELRAGRRAAPRWSYVARPHEELRRALGAVERVLERADLRALEGLYLDRTRELAVEAAMCACAGSPELPGLARQRFEPSDGRIARRASALCREWLSAPGDEATSGTFSIGGEDPKGPGEPVVSDDEDPRSLYSMMAAAVGRLRLPFAVVRSQWLAPLAATGERVILIATGRPVPEEDARRTVVHEIEGHARPRARSAHAAAPHFRFGTARGIDDQEGRAVLLEERAGLLGPRRRRQLAARHWAVEAMFAGASFAEVAWDLLDRHGLDPCEAVIVAERSFRGGDGTRPGLGRERVYLESLVRVRDHLAAHPEDDAVLAAGQVAVDTIDVLRPFAPPPG